MKTTRALLDQPNEMMEGGKREREHKAVPFSEVKLADKRRSVDLGRSWPIFSPYTRQMLADSDTGRNSGARHQQVTAIPLSASAVGTDTCRTLTI